MVFSIFIELYNYHHNLILILLHDPQKKARTLKQSLCFPLPPGLTN